MNAPFGSTEPAAPVSYATILHREHRARLARMAPAPKPAPIKPAVKAPLGEIMVYPCFVFDEAVDEAPLISVGPCRVREIQDLVCKILNVRRADMTSPRRDRLSVMARQVAMYLCKRHTPNSLPDLGRRFGGRDHTTVLHAIERVERTIGSPMGTSVSVQWLEDYCDIVREAVALAEAEIATWPEARTSRVRYPARRRP